MTDITSRKLSETRCDCPNCKVDAPFDYEVIWKGAKHELFEQHILVKEEK